MKQFPYLEMITAELNSFTGSKGYHGERFGEDICYTYTQSEKYLLWCVLFHNNYEVRRFTKNLKDIINRDEKMVDVGCLGGATGLQFALDGYKIDFHDFEGVGLKFIRHMIAKYDLHSRVIPYGDNVNLDKNYDWAIAFDVLEHTGNHLAFIKWLSNLATNFAFCYPNNQPFLPPYEKQLDEWVDDDAIGQIIKARYENSIVDVDPHGRTFVIVRRDGH